MKIGNVRRIWILILAVLMITMLTASVYAENVKVTKTTASLNYSENFGAVAQGNTLKILKNLPFELNVLNFNFTIVANSSTASTTVNVYVNGVLVENQTSIAGGKSLSINLTDLKNAGVNVNATELNITVTPTANATASETLSLSADNAVVVSGFSYSVSQEYLSKPVVKYYEDNSFYAVKQTVKVTQNTSVNLTNVVCTFSYPYDAISKSYTTYNFGTLNTSQTKSCVLSFEKKGPYIISIYTNKFSKGYSTIIKIYSPENLTAKFTFSPFVMPYSKYFKLNNKKDITGIYLNNNKISYTDPQGYITCELGLVKGYNTLSVNYTKPTPTSIPPVIVESTSSGPNTQTIMWAFIVILLVAILVVVLKR